MMWKYFAVFTFLLNTCAGRINKQHDTSRATSTLVERICWPDGKLCNSTNCINCCAGTSYFDDITSETFCGNTPCLADGYDCGGDGNCWNCCNGAYEDGGNTCGGQCLSSGTECEISSTCNQCCNYTYWKNGDTYECGCMEDGSSCIPGASCYQCCNGAYDDNGSTCGGTCVPDGTECAFGEDCQLCCSMSNFWYSTGQHTCGEEPCYADGESCVPYQSCNKCCNGAYDGDGTICGGECLDSGTECSFFSTCSKCCDDNSYWDATTDSMKCGYKDCLDDGTSCMPGESCYNCCNGAFDDNGKKCGGTCLPEGTECDYYGNCNLCCGLSREYSSDLGIFKCSSYEDYYDDDTLNPPSNAPSAI